MVELTRKIDAASFVLERHAPLSIATLRRHIAVALTRPERMRPTLTQKSKKYIPRRGRALVRPAIEIAVSRALDYSLPNYLAQGNSAV
jgi:hypothetical protein